MKHILVVLVLLPLVGCGSRTQQNAGAQIAVHIGSAQHMFDVVPLLAPGCHRNDVLVSGYTELPSKEITISEQVHEWRLVEVWTHELLYHAMPQYAAEHGGVIDIKDFLRQYEGRGLNFNEHKGTK